MPHVDFKKCQCRRSLLLNYFPCPLSNLRNANVPCHYIIWANVAVDKGHVTLSNLKNGHVALSILGVWGRNHLKRSGSSYQNRQTPVEGTGLRQRQQRKEKKSQTFCFCWLLCSIFDIIRWTVLSWRGEEGYQGSFLGSNTFCNLGTGH